MEDEKSMLSVKMYLINTSSNVRVTVDTKVCWILKALTAVWNPRR